MIRHPHKRAIEDEGLEGGRKLQLTYPRRLRGANDFWSRCAQKRQGPILTLPFLKLT